MPKHTIEEDDEILDEASFRQRVLELETYGLRAPNSVFRSENWKENRT